MKTILSLFLTIISILLFAQEKEIKKLTYSFHLSPEFNALVPDENSENETTTSKLGFSAGFDIQLNLSSRFSIVSGLGYGLIRYNWEKTGLILGSDIDPILGVISESSQEYSINYSEIRLPLLLKYSIIMNKLVFQCGFEASYLFADHSERIIHRGDGTDENMGDLDKKIVLAPTMSFGYIIPISDQHLLSIEPVFRYYINNFDAFISLGPKHYNFGLRFRLII